MTQTPIPTPRLPAPGPKGLPIIGNVLDMRSGEMHETMLEMHKTYGDIVQLSFPGGTAGFSIRHPDMFQQVLQMNNHNYIKGSRFDIAKPLIGDGLFISEGETWRRHRRMMQPAFHRKQIDALADEMVQTTLELMETWNSVADNGQVVNVQHDMMGLTMEVVTRTLFTNSLKKEEIAQVGEYFSFVLDVITDRGNAILPIWEKFPSARNRKFDEGIAVINEIIYRLIRDRRASGENGSDLLGMLLEARDEDGVGMTDNQLRDELVTMFLAGHETTAIALSWSVGLLSQNPAVRRRLQEEVDRVIGDRLPTAADYPNLPYTTAVFQEALRLYPPLPFSMRQAIGKDEIAGYPIPPGSIIFINFYALHHNPDFWKNPEGFDPERFLPENSQGQHKFAYLPFSGGPRQCIGNTFALMEGTLVLAMIAQRFNLDLVDGTRLEPGMIGTLRPKGGVPVHLSRR